MNRAALALALAALPSLAQAQAAGQWKGPEQIWGASCGYCHDTGVGPQIKGLKLPPAAVARIVRQGLPGMPNFHPSEIGDRELHALAVWVSTAPPPRPGR